MNLKRFFYSVLAVFVAYEGLGYLINTVLLNECYVELEQLWRKDMDHYMWVMFLSDFILINFLVLFYSRWSKSFTIWSGLLFGLLAGVMVSTVSSINQWVIYPLSNHILVLWVLFGLIQFAISGLILGLIYKPRKFERY